MIYWQMATFFLAVMYLIKCAECRLAWARAKLFAELCHLRALEEQRRAASEDKVS
jgi:hypothetical protein